MHSESLDYLHVTHFLFINQTFVINMFSVCNFVAYSQTHEYNTLSLYLSHKTTYIRM